MAVYAVRSYRITDPEGIAEYRKKVCPELQKAGGEIIVLNDHGFVVEGGVPSPTVFVLKFPEREAMIRWYNSDENRATTLPRRLDATTDSWSVTSDEYVMPETGVR